MKHMHGTDVNLAKVGCCFGQSTVSFKEHCTKFPSFLNPSLCEIKESGPHTARGYSGVRKCHLWTTQCAHEMDNERIGPSSASVQRKSDQHSADILTHQVPDLILTRITSVVSSINNLKDYIVVSFYKGENDVRI